MFEAAAAMRKFCFKQSLLIYGFWYVRTCVLSYNILLLLKPEKCLLLLHLPVGYHRQTISCVFSKLSGTLKTNTTIVFVHGIQFLSMNSSRRNAVKPEMVYSSDAKLCFP